MSQIERKTDWEKADQDNQLSLINAANTTNNPWRDAWRWDRRLVAMLLAHSFGCVIIGYGLAADFGMGKLIALLAAFVVAESLAVIAVLDTRFYWFPRLSIALFLTYGTLVVCDLTLSLSASSMRKNPHLQMKGQYTKDAEIGYRLTPNWTGTYDDGAARGEYKYNSLGHRDDEPPSDGQVEAVLMGDSFAFGMLLDQTDTIDKQIERISQGRINAYNLGVVGYGPPNILTSYERLTQVRGNIVFYLCYNNDLRLDNSEIDLGATVVDGYLVLSHDDQGRKLSEDELRSKVSEEIAQIELRASQSFQLGSSLRLGHLRSRVAALLAGDASLLSGRAEEFSRQTVELAVSNTLQMSKLATERQADFAIVIVPTKGEVLAGRYSSVTLQFMDALQLHGITVLELLDRLSEKDYFEHDEHFNSSGARKTAAVIVDYMEDHGVDATNGTSR